MAQNPVLDGLMRGFQIAQQIKGFQRQQQASGLAQQREQRMAEQDRLRGERQAKLDEHAQLIDMLNLRRQIRNEGGRRLNAKEKAILNAGDDFSLELAPGFATTASSGERFDAGEESYLLPSVADLTSAEQSRARDAEDEQLERSTVALPPQLAAATGIPEGTRVRPQDLDDLGRQFGEKPTPQRRLEQITNERTGDVQFVDPQTGEVVSLFKGAGQKRPPEPKTPSATDRRYESDEYVRQAASEVLAQALRADGTIDVDVAVKLAGQKARKDPAFKKSLSSILAVIESRRPRGSSGGGGLDALERALGGGAETAPGPAAGPSLDSSIDEFLRLNPSF